MIKPEKKASKDIHAVFSFRLSPEEKGSLSREVESIRGRLNKRRADTEKLIKKHDVILAALKKGLTALKSEAGEK